MVKSLFLFVAVLFLSVAIRAQNFYLKPRVRYHIPVTRQEAPEFFNAAIVVATGSGYYYTDIITYNSKFSLAKGPDYGVTLGYRFNDHIGIETGLQYFEEKQELNSEDVFPHYPIGSTSWQFRSFNATPSLVISHTTGNFTLSANAGLLAGLTSLGRSVFFDNKRRTFKFNSSLSTGYTIGLELGLKISSAFALTAEAGIQNQFYKPRKALIQYDDFSYYELDELPVYLRKIIYVKDIDNETVYYDNQSDTYYTGLNRPLMRLRETLKLNSFYTGIALKYIFGAYEKN